MLTQVKKIFFSQPVLNVKELYLFLLVSPPRQLYVQYFRYFFVGGTAFAVDFGLLYLLTDVFLWHHLVSAALSFSVGLIVNYVVSSWWVFNAVTSKYSQHSEFALFGIIGVVGVLLNEGIIFTLTDLAGFHYLMAKAASGIIVFSVNFLLRRYLLFK